MLKSIFSKSNSKKDSKSFLNAIKPFFTNRGIITNGSITLGKNKILKNNPKETTEVFYDYYIHIVETTSGNPPSSVNPNSQCQDRANTVKNH